MHRQLALPWVVTVAVVALMVGGALGTVVGYVAHGDDQASFRQGPGGFPQGPGGGFPQGPGNGQPRPGS